MSLFRKASKSQSRLRLALIGPSGSGKTYSSLVIATELAAHMRSLGGPGRIAVIDTERGSASKYADRFSFEVLELAQCDPRNYVEAIEAAQGEGFDVLVIDSLSHAWSGKGGALELVDKAAKQSKSNNTFMAWRNVTPLHNALVDTIIGSGCHVIATMRSKVDYVMEADPNTGKLTPKKVGMAPIQREGMDYEFDVVGDIDLDHNLMVTKTRCERLDGEVINRPGKVFARTLINWLTDGAPAPIAQPTVQHPVQSRQDTAQATIAAQASEALPFLVGSLSDEMTDHIRELVALTGMSDERLQAALVRRGVRRVEELSVDNAQTLINGLEKVAQAAVAEQSADRSADQIGNELINHLVSQSNGHPASETAPTTDQASAPVETSTLPDPTDDHIIPDTSRAEREPVKPKRRTKGEAVVSPEPSVA